MDSRFNKSRIEDFVKWVMKNKKVKYTDFLNLSEQNMILKYLNGYVDIKCVLFGGYKTAERKIAVIYNDFINIKATNNVPINAMRIEGNLSNISHRDVLGALLGLGIKREKLGDIIRRENNCDILVHNEIKDYILANLIKIGKQHVKIYSIELEDIIEPVISFKNINTTIASIRFDTILASGFNLSRNKSAALIKSCLVEVNWETIDEPSYILKEGDIISLRGHGRLKFNTINGFTKKGRISVNLLRYK